MTSSRLPEDWSRCFVVVSDGYWDALLRFATGLVRQRADAEDVVQGALIKAMKNFSRFCQTKLNLASASEATARLTTDEKLKAHMRNWLFKIVRHAAYDVLSVQVVEAVEVDEDFAELTTPPATFVAPDRVLEFEKQFYRHALDDEWHKKLEALTARQRTVLFLAAEGQSYREIADLLEIPMGTVMSNLSRALEKLKKTDVARPAE